jgi:hypothetical protein
MGHPGRKPVQRDQAGGSAALLGAGRGARDQALGAEAHEAPPDRHAGDGVTATAVTGRTADAIDFRWEADHVPGPEFAQAPARSFGTETLHLAIGPIRIRLEGLSAPQRASLEARYGIFVTRGDAGQPAVRVQIFQSEREGFLRSASSGEQYRILTRWHGTLLTATSYEWSGWIDRVRWDAGLALARITTTDTAAFDRSVENFLRLVMAHSVVPRGGFLFHSAGIVRDGRAYLFFGPSGSGKTTTTGLSLETGAEILSDDLALIVKGEDGTPSACSVPFRGVYAPEYTMNRLHPIAGFFRLIQDPGDRLERLQGAAAVGEVVGSVPFVTDRTEMAGDLLDVVGAAVARVPVFRLYFTKSRRFWDTLAEAGIAPPVDSFSTDRGMKA